ncbi:hypothetical protein N431DRAFT_453112 [Stipitochalara longipes BDJ]|nr:hypothetical protein N431DRAFT_453112 [Stipitochalara longipes BDJ]
MSPIALRANKCVGLFEDLVELLRQPDQQYDYGISDTETTDAFGRFKIWAGNIGAFQQIDLKSSLDFRLRESPKISTQILEILDDLAESLEDACSIASNVRENRKSFSLTYASDTKSSHHDQGEQFEDSEELSEMREIFKSMQDAINNLFRYSIIIRNNTNRNRYAKATASAIGSPFNDEFDIQHLVGRLGKAITQRRQYLGYCRSHHDKTWHEPVSKAGPDILRSNEQKPQGPTRLMPSSRSGFSKPTSTLAPTQGPTLLMTTSQFIEEEAVEETQSQTSYATSADVDSNNQALQVIQLEDVSKGLRHFECPYCWQIQTYRAQKAWKKHVLSDLKPYVCTFEDCELKPFSDQQTWFSHELKDHRKEWKCPFCAHSAFKKSIAYHDHLTTHHPQAFTEDQLPALFEMSQKPFLKMSPTDCPFCDDWEERLRAVNLHISANENLVITLSQFQHHVGAHMVQLALFAILRGYTEEGEADSANAAPQIDADDSSLSENEPDLTTAKQLRQCEDVLDSLLNMRKMRIHTITYTYFDSQSFRYNYHVLARSPSVDVEAELIAIQLRNGERVTRRFLPDADFEGVCAFVECYDLIRDATHSPPIVGEPTGYIHEYNFRLRATNTKTTEDAFYLRAGLAVRAVNSIGKDLEVVDLGDGEPPQTLRRTQERSTITPYEHLINQAGPRPDIPHTSQAVGGKKRLDASGPREVVFCHVCENKYYHDESGMVCPRCTGEITEIITPESDPRPVLGNEDGSDISGFLHSTSFAPGSELPGPEEAENEERLTQGSGGSALFPRTAVQTKVQDAKKVGVLTVFVDRARNLPNDAAPNTQAPYCRVQLGHVIKRTGKDSLGGGTPLWDEELQLDVLDGSFEYLLHVTVHNGGGEEIGRAVINLKELSAIEERREDDWWRLTGRGVAAGEISLGLRLLRDK